MRDQRFVGRRHRIVAQLGRPRPFELLSFPRLDEPFQRRQNVERHEQVEVGVGMARKGQRREALLLDGDSQFLPQLSNQALFGPFARLDLAARKLPQSRIDLPGGRCAMSTRPSGSISAQAATRTSLTLTAGLNLKEWRVKAYSIQASP